MASRPSKPGDDAAAAAGAGAKERAKRRGKKKKGPEAAASGKTVGQLLAEYTRQTRVASAQVQPRPDDAPLPERTVQVMLRLRPLDSRDGPAPGAFLDVQGSSVVSQNISRIPGKVFTYDEVFVETAQQHDVYLKCLKPLLPDFLRGINVSLFCYGQTGSGKTWTMFGASGIDVEGLGLVPRVLATLFGRTLESDTPPHAAASSAGASVPPQLAGGDTMVVKEDDSQILSALPSVTPSRGASAATSTSEAAQVSFSVSALEIYNEEVRDLSDDDMPKLEIRETPRAGAHVHGLRQYPIDTMKDAIRILELVMRRRTSGSTQMNAISSRSHVVFTLYCDRTEAGDIDGATRRTSKLHLVDLAGSERLKRSKAEGTGKREGAAINKSLSCLGNVINALASGKTHVPYRDSKLTRILQDSLGGNSLTRMIATVSSAESSAMETLSTLRFADRVKQVKNQARINHDPAQARLRELLAERNSLLAECEALRAANSDLHAKLTGGGGSRRQMRSNAMQTSSAGGERTSSRTCVLL